ncbi:MAG: hypothetical protein E7390_09050 [Ruminococcaceae bacterium]|nr:hypothetical protein [Oscillospiraceae bacterium]
MKKTILLLSIFCLLLSGCSSETNNEPAETMPAESMAPAESAEDDATPSEMPAGQTASPTATPAAAENNTPLSQMYVDIIKSGDYFMKAKVQAASGVSEFAVSVNQESTAMETETDGVLYTVVIRDGVTYMINHESKMVITSSADVAGSASHMAADALSTEGITYTGKGTATFNGASCSYEEYKTPAGGTMRFYFRNSALVGIDNVADSLTTTYFIEEISAGHHAGMHEIPADYQLLDMAALGG